MTVTLLWFQVHVHNMLQYAVTYRNCDPWEKPIALKPLANLSSDDNKSQASSTCLLALRKKLLYES